MIIINKIQYNMDTEIGFIYIKNEGLDDECEKEILQLLLLYRIEILKSNYIVLNENLLRNHQPIIFTEEKENEFWKHQSVERMLNKKVKVFLLQSKECIALTDKIKKLIRAKYTPKYDNTKKISYPTYMHSASDRPEVERDVFYLMPEQIELLHKINGIHEELIKQQEGKQK